MADPKTTTPEAEPKTKDVAAETDGSVKAETHTLDAPYPSQAEADAIKAGTFKRETAPEGDRASYKTR